MDFLKGVGGIHRNWSYLTARRFYFLMFGMLFSSQICEKLLMESQPDITCIAGSKQHIENPNFEANKCITDGHRYQFWAMLHIRM